MYMLYRYRFAVGGR